MGHERVGALPRTVRWGEIVHAIGGAIPADKTKVATIAENTLRHVRSRFTRLSQDSGVQAAFSYFIALATDQLPSVAGSMTSVDVGLKSNPSPTRISKDLSDWVAKNIGEREYAALSVRASADTIAEWTRQHSRQSSLFDDKVLATDIWRSASDGRGFCEVARIFFARLTERYLHYFLDREASAEIGTLAGREEFDSALRDHLQEVSRHAFETSKITQSFAAGWFNKHAKESRPIDGAIEAFLSLAFGKMYEELGREGSA